MNPPLRLDVHVAAHRTAIRATGLLTAKTANLLPEAVIDTLRRHAVPTLVLDLSRVTVIDDVGEAALQHCECEAGRRGALLTIEPAPTQQRQRHRAR